MIQKYRHVSFDLDGTLVHTVPEYRHELVPRVVAKLGGRVREPRSIDRFWFESSRANIIRNEFELDPKKFWDLFHALDIAEERAHHTWLYPDAEPTLQELKRRGKGLSIITGAPQWIADMEIGKLTGVTCDYCLSITHSPYSEKPDPASFVHVMQHLGLEPHDVIYVGNSNEDAYYAKNAGVDFIYLERKEHEFDLKDYALATISSLSELLGER